MTSKTSWLFTTRSKFVLYMSVLLCLSVWTSASHANPFARQQAPTTEDRTDQSYASFGFMLNEFRSINLPLESEEATGGLPNFFPESAQTYGVAISYGSFISDSFKIEVRAGTGIRDDTVKEALDVNLAYWLSWFIGYDTRVTDYMTAYAMYGFSIFEADETRRQVIVSAQTDNFGSREDVVAQPSDALKDGLFKTDFSPSWMIGIEIDLVDQWSLGVEYGILISDSDSNLNVRQAGTHLRYRF